MKHKCSWGTAVMAVFKAIGRAPSESGMQALYHKYGKQWKQWKSFNEFLQYEGIGPESEV